MKTTECCGHKYIGDNHSPIRPDGYCLHCGFHPEIESLKAEISIYKANERITQMRIDDLKEANKVLRDAVIYYRKTPVRVLASCDVEVVGYDKFRQGKVAGVALAKADEITLAMQIIDKMEVIQRELLSVAEVHLDDTFEKIKEVEEMKEGLK